MFVIQFRPLFLALLGHCFTNTAMFQQHSNSLEEKVIIFKGNTSILCSEKALPEVSQQ